MTLKLHILLLCSCVLVCCTKRHTSDQTTEQDSVASSVEPISDEIDTICTEVPQKALAGPPEEIEKTATTQHQTSSCSSRSTSSSSYSSHSGEESSDYWEEKRKHSPNDNYLLGFDEDVDDVHDMELYIEDY